MSPKELRAFRESLGLSRREFAPKLFISDPTLERWERGQGGPREVHLQILRRMREHLSAGHSIAYFRYDAGEEARAAELLHETKEMIVETLRGIGALVVAEKESEDGQDWSVIFGMGWAVGQPIDLTLHCEGSERAERPAIDFVLKIGVRCEDTENLSVHLQRLCQRHNIFGHVKADRDVQVVISLGYRLFKTGCNPETITHVVGNFRSCWQRMKDALKPAPAETTEREVEGAASSRTESRS